LHSLLADGAKNPEAPLPDLPLDASVSPMKPGEKAIHGNRMQSAEFKREVRVLTCRIFQREILGTITTLLRNEDFAPAIGRLEPLFRKSRETSLTEARAALEGTRRKLGDLQNRVVPPVQQRAVERELNLLRSEIERSERKLADLEASSPGDGFETAYSPELRAEIRAMAETFLKSVPPERRRGASAMPGDASTK
jgi:hypothetical protein